MRSCRAICTASPTGSVADHALTVNGDARPAPANGYAGRDRDWKAGDVITLTLPMPVRRILANDAVEADRGRVALQRGPIVYAAEWPDNPNGKVRNIVLPDDAPLTSEFRSDLLRGVQVIKGRANGLAYDARGRAKTAQDFMAIPYATWANRGRGQMIVWLATRRRGPADAVADCCDHEHRDHSPGVVPARSTTAKIPARRTTRPPTSTGGRVAAPRNGSNTRSRNRPGSRASRSTGSTTLDGDR